nr:MAG TPA: DNA-directed RNA polymerase [Caudoviricetes sp.]
MAMERLTHKRANGIKEGYWSPNKKQELVDTLAAYENTGLTPEQIIELKYRNNEEEISETQSYGVYFYECPICNEPVHEKDNFCCKCGQRLKRRD